MAAEHRRQPGRHLRPDWSHRAASLVARIVNALDLDVRSGHFWGMDEWFDVETGREVEVTHPLSFERADRELCFNRIRRALRMPDDLCTFRRPTRRSTGARGTPGCGARSCRAARATSSTGPSMIRRRDGTVKDAPPPPAEYRKLATRVVDLHPLTIAQNARTSGGGNISMVPTKAISVGPVETWKAEKVSIWHAGMHDNPFGQRLTALMISKGGRQSVPMSLLADHPNVQFNYYRGGMGFATSRCIEGPRRVDSS